MTHEGATKSQLKRELEALRRRVAELEASQLSGRPAELSSEQGRDWYRTLFEDFPVSLWLVDDSELKRHIDSLRESGVKDIAAHVREHPEAAAAWPGMFKVLDVNKATLQLCKAQTKEQFLGRLHELWTEDASVAFLEAIAALADGKTSSKMETTTRTLEGDVRHVAVRYAVAPGCEQTWARVLVSIADITPCKEAEEALRRSEERYRSLFEDSPFPLLAMDCSGIRRWVVKARDSGVNDFDSYLTSHPEAVGEFAVMIQVLDANKAALHLLKAETKENLRNQFRALWTEDSYRVLKEGLVAFAGGGSNFESESNTRTFAGQERRIVLRCSLVPGYEAPWARVLVSALDITERKEAEQLRLSESRFRQLAENIKQVFWMSNLDMSEIIYISPAYEKVWGRTRESVYKDPPSWLRAVHPDDYRRVLRALERKVHGHDEEYRIVRPDGCVRVIRDRAFPVRDEQGNVYRLAGIAEDITDRKRAEEALRESEEKYRSFVEQSLAGIVIAQGRPPRIVFANAALAEIFGCTPEELTSLPAEKLEELAHPDDRAVFFGRFYQRLDGKQVPPHYEARVIRRDGAVRWLEISSNRIEYGGQPAVQATFIDVTERKQAEEALRKSEERYRTLFESIHDGIIVSRPDGTIVSANPAAARLTGCQSPEELKSRKTSDFYPDPETRAWVIAQLMEHGHVSFEAKARRRDGTRFISLVALTAHFDPDGEIELIDGLFKDITERKRAEEELAAEKERLVVTLQSIGDGVIATDTHGNVTLLNAVAERLTGWTLREAAGRPLSEVFHVVDEKTRRSRQDPVAEALTTQRTSGLASDSLLLARDGAERLITYSATAIRDAGGNTLGAVLAFRDISERRKMQEELIKAERINSIGILAGGIAHDFNNILTAVTGNIFLARMCARADREMIARLSDAERAIFRAKTLTLQLLAFSKGGAPVKRAASVPELIQEGADFALSGSNVGCESSIPEGLWAVEVDAGQIIQVVHNLVINAAQAMPTGGVVRISAENVTVTGEESSPLKQGKYVRVSVRDHGVGIPREHFGRIFEPYFTTKPRGTGLGLATAYTIVARHSGYMNFDSQPGVETTFCFYLPASDKQPPKQDRRAPEATPGRGRILLMDDDTHIRYTTRELLTRLGYEVRLASDGDEALQEFLAAKESGCPFDAVILDLTIAGGMSGKDTMAKLLETDPAIKAIASSGYSNDPIMADYQTYGFSGVIAKPYTGEELSRELHKVLNLPRQ